MKYLIIVVSFITSICSCNKANKENLIDMKMDVAADAFIPNLKEDAMPPLLPQAKQVIKIGNLVVEVENNLRYDEYVKSLQKEHGVYISKEENSVVDNQQQTTLTLRVPAANFEGVMKGLVTKDTRLLERTINAEDVSGAIVDTRTRLEAKKAARDKCLQLLQKANK